MHASAVPVPLNPLPLRRWLLPLAALLLAATLRLWHLASVPPGLYYDEAGHLLSAESIGRAGVFPVYFGFGEGNDPLLPYLARFNMLILGPVPWAGRLVSAWAGLVSVAATILVGRLLFPGQAVGPLAGLLLSTLFWHINLSRYGTQPMLAGALTTASVAAFLIAVRSRPRTRRYFVWGGALVSLGLLSYVAVRLFLLVPAAIVLHALLRTRRRRPLVLGAALSAAICGVLILPQVVFFIHNPTWFTERLRVTTSSTLSSANPLGALAANVWKVLWGLVGVGPVDQRQNLPGRPALDLVQTALLIVGGAAAFGARGPRRSAFGLVGLWLFVGLLPAILTENPPNFQRTIMATMPLALLIGAGVEFLWTRLPAPRLARPALAGLLGISALVNAGDYFGRWAADPATARAHDEGLYWITQQLRSAPAGTTLYETPVLREWLTFEYGLGSEAYQRFRDFNGRACLVIPAESPTGAVYGVITAEDLNTLPSLQAAFPNGRVLAEHFIGGAPYASIFEVPPRSALHLAPAQPRQIDYAGQLRLLGYTLDSTDLHPGNSLRLALTWQMLQTTPAELKVFIHVLGPAQADGSPVYAQRDAEPCDNAYPTWQWVPGEILIDQITLDLPADLQPGPFQLNVGWYDAVTLQRLAAVADSGQPLGDSVELETINIGAP